MNMIDIGNIAVLIERGLGPDQAAAIAKQWNELCAENARLRAVSPPEPTEGQVEAMAKAAFEIDWPKDDWSRFKPGDYVPERYRKIVRAALRAMPLQDHGSSNGLINDIIRDVAELPDRTSPADQPDMMLVSADELRSLLMFHLSENVPRAMVA